MAMAMRRVRRTGGKKSVAKAAVTTLQRVVDRPERGGNHEAPELFLPLTEGERADALRLTTEEPRLRAMAKVGRYRVIAVEPLVVKPPHERAGHRLARVMIFDYSANRSVGASVDLDDAEVFHVAIGGHQPMLSPDEERDAVAVALAEAAVKESLALGDEPVAVLQYWSKHAADMAHARRSAAVLFGPRDGATSVVVIVNLIDRVVTEVVPAAQW